MEFHINVTGTPERCTRCVHAFGAPHATPKSHLLRSPGAHVRRVRYSVAEEGDLLRIHYIGKLLATEAIFDSSFHTGSMPVKVRARTPPRHAVPFR